MSTNDQAIHRLLNIVRTLRSPDGCPWDLKQNHQTLKQFLREESAELLEAIDQQDDAAIVEELGDVLLQVLLHARIAEEEGRFDFGTVANSCADKLVRRHPHVFGDVNEVGNADEVRAQWEELKKAEKKESGNEHEDSAIANVPYHLSALHRAHKIQSKAAKTGFDWPGTRDVCDKVSEELAEVREAAESADDAALAEEVGDLLFAVVNLSRFSQRHPEDVLHDTVRKFEKRFRRMESLVQSEETSGELQNHPLEVLDAYWEKAKEEERKERTND